MGRHFIDEAGKQYGRLTVLRIASDDEYPRGQGKPVMWLCQCSCGNQTFAPGRDLRSGRRVSCGCQSREKAKDLAYILGKKNEVNLIGQKFGSLLVLERSQRTEDMDKKYYAWKCLCDCENITYVRSNYLLSGHTKTCGCRIGLKLDNAQGSKGEQFIASLLSNSDYEFEREKTFRDLHGGHYRYDFYLSSENTVIEYNGAQHYQYYSYFHKSKTDFLKAQERDRIKISYCLARDIKIYCIPYWEIDNLKTLDDLFQPQFLAHSRYHNDIAFEQQKSKG